MESIQNGIVKFKPKMFIEFNKEDKNLYLSYYIEEYKVIIKVAISNPQKEQKPIILDHFKLCNNIYLTNID